MENIISKALEWDDLIENDGQQWLTLPEGDYDFKVTDFERARHAGSAKIPPCNKAIVTMVVGPPQGCTTVRYNLFLHSKQEWKLCQFFTAIGQRKHGEKLYMNWAAVMGSTGHCKIGIHKWTNDKGEEKTVNEVLEFYKPNETANATQEPPKFTPGAF